MTGHLKCSSSLTSRLATLGICLWTLCCHSCQALEADAAFPDHDCTRKRHSDEIIPWSDWREALAGASAASGGSGGLLDISLPYIVLLQDVDARAAASEQCPLGVLMASVLELLLCYAKWGLSGCFADAEPAVRLALADTGLRVLWGTRWPILETLNADIWREAPQGDVVTPAELAAAAGLDCEGLANPVLDWKRFKNVFQRPDWYQDAVDMTYGPELEESWRSASAQCPLGFTMANIVKAMLCAHTESICFHAHARVVEGFIGSVDLHLILGSGWPVFQLLAHTARVTRRHGFELDFDPIELTAPQSIDEKPLSAAYSALIGMLPAVKKSAKADLLAQKLSSTSAEDEGIALVHTSMAYGAQFSPYVGRFIRRARAVGVSAMVMFCLDAHAMEMCTDVEGFCIPGTPSILNKFTLPLVLLKHGLDVLWLDMDVFLFQSPLPAILRDERKAEILISGTFAIDCICSGIVYFRSCSSTQAWLLELLMWMYAHPYEHDQKAVSAFLRAGERVAFDRDLPVDIDKLLPTWDFLDPETEFITASHVEGAGWTGDASNIIAFHLLHGDSDATDASRQFASRFGLGLGYLPLLDLFFNQSEELGLYNTPVLPHDVSQELRDALWRSRFSTPRPANRPNCNVTVPMQY